MVIVFSRIKSPSRNPGSINAYFPQVNGLNVLRTVLGDKSEEFCASVGPGDIFGTLPAEGRGQTTRGNVGPTVLLHGTSVIGAR